MSDSEEENNNPFAGTNHLYASGIAATLPHQEETSPLSTTMITNYEPYISLSMSHEDTQEPANFYDGAIKIIDAGDYKDPWGKHAIGYLIRYKDKQVIRRYSEFDSLRKKLTSLHPTVVIPPLPFKHSLLNYFLNPLKGVDPNKIVVDKRKRLLASFLNHCHALDETKNDVVFQKFLNPEYLWKDVLNSAPINIIPSNNLQAPPLAPTNPSPMHSLLPSPIKVDPVVLTSKDIRGENFVQLEKKLNQLRMSILPIYRMVHQDRHRLHSLATTSSELGAYYNCLSLESTIRYQNDAHFSADKIEKIGHFFDINYISLETFVAKMVSHMEEPLMELLQFLDESKRVLMFRNLKLTQYQILVNTLTAKQQRVQSLQNAQSQIRRLDAALQRNAKESPTIANTLKQNATETEPAAAEEEEQNEEDPNLTAYKSLIMKRNRKQLRRTSKLEPHLLTEEERQEEIVHLQREIDKLNECFKLVEKDVQQVNESTFQNLTKLLRQADSTLSLTLKLMTKNMIIFLKEGISVWQDVKAIQDPATNSK